MTDHLKEQDHPLAPNRPLEPITWKQAPAEPHGYYDRMHYARGWNDAVSVAQAVTPEVAQMMKFYNVKTKDELIKMQAHHIERLQAKLPQDNQPAFTRVREG